jgi:hypothetical protein
MLLVELSGDLNKKFLVSASYTLEQLRKSISTNLAQQKAMFIFVKSREGKSKTCDFTMPLKEIHERYS